MNSHFTYYTLKSLVRRHKELRLPIFLCSITIAIMVMISISYSTIQHTVYEANKASYGSWHIAIYNASPNTHSKLEKNVLLEQMGTMTIYGKIASKHSQTNNYIGSVDDTTLSLTSMQFEQGCYPKNSSEIALEKELLLELGLPDVLGSTVTLSFTDADHAYQQATFTLCGIITPYHNNYLRQGPLVTAFVSANSNYFKHGAISLNDFVSLKSNYATKTISHELSSFLQDSSKTSNEYWYYNTYIESSSGISLTTVFLMIAIGAILLTSTYLSFFRYYSHRFKTLLSSQVLNLDKKKIKQLFHIESLLLFPLYGFIGGLCGLFGTFLLYHIASYFYCFIHFYVNYRFLLIAVGLTILCLFFIVIASRHHCSYIMTREPVLHLPSTPAPIRPEKYPRFLYLMKRYLYVYKKSLFYHIVLHTIGISSLLFMVTSWYYTYNCWQQLSTNKETDYSIVNIKNIDPLINKLSQIRDFPEVRDVSYYAYTTIGSILLVGLDDPSMAPLDQHCYLNALPNLSDEMIGINDKTLLLQSGDATYPLTIQNYSISHRSDERDPLRLSDYSFVYCNSKQYKEIISFFHIPSYYYVKIRYEEECNPSVVTNIIDRMFVDTTDMEIIHSNLLKDHVSIMLLTNTGFLTLLCLFTFLISFVILRNHQKAGLQYLNKDLMIFWSLGLTKRSLRRYTLILNMLCAVISIPFALFVTFGFDSYHLSSYFPVLQYNLGSFLLLPAVVGLFLSFLLLYFLMYFFCVLHDINQTLKNMYNLA